MHLHTLPAVALCGVGAAQLGVAVVAPTPDVGNRRGDVGIFRPPTQQRAQVVSLAAEQAQEELAFR